MKAIPLDPVDALAAWGISASSIEDYGRWTGEDSDPHTLRGLVWRLRNAVAHFRFEPRPSRGEVEAFHFCDANGFRATVPLHELRAFVERLAQRLRTM